MFIEKLLLPDGSTMPRLGQGTWKLAEDDTKAEREIAGLRHGFDIGFDLIDTAEMYADGKSELLVGKALRGYNRDGQFIVSKVYPENANRKRIYSSLDRSLALLGTDYLGLVVSPRHPFARRMSVRLDEIQQENMVMRPKGAETRRMFESYVISNGYLPRDFHVSMELDSVSNIKEIVMADLGISVLSHNVCLDELKRGQLVIVPIENCQMVRSINLIYPDDFSAPAVLQDIRRKYEEHFN